MQATEELRVLVVEDEPIILRHIGAKIAGLPGFYVAGLAENGHAALELLAENSADVLVTDIEMPGLGGLDLIGEVCRLYPNMQIIIISGYSNFTYAQRALRYGVVDYLLKPLEEAALAGALRHVGENEWNRRQGAKVLAQYQRQERPALPPEAAEDTAQLARQIEKYIFTCYNKPLTIAHLAETFNYTPSYINRIFKKEYGISPIQYQINLRIQRAKELMGDYPTAEVKDVAAAVGYDDPRYFSRVFKQSEGIVPSEYGK